MRVARPTIDERKLVQVRCDRRDIPALRAALGKLDQALGARRRRRSRLFLAVTAALLALLLADLLGGDALAPAGAMVLAALAYAYGATLLVSLFQRRDGSLLQRTPRLLRMFLLVNPGAFLYLGASARWGAQAALIDPQARPIPCALGLAASVAAVIWVRQLATWDRLARVRPQRLEVDYLARIVEPLLADLPAGARATLSFNPFRSEWSRVKLDAPRARAGYTFDAGADVLLALKVPLDAGRTFRLSVVETSVHKTKNRKQKYKGTKRSLAYRCEIDLAPGAVGGASPGAAARVLDPDFARYLRTATRGWTPSAETAGGFFEGLPAFAEPHPSLLKLSARARPDRVSATAILKSQGSSRELAPEHLLPPSFVLAAVRFVGRAAASAG
jgi:hypothetical protein